MLLSRDNLLQFKPATRDVVLSGRGGSVQVRELRAAEVVKFTNLRTSDPSAAIDYLIETAVVDESGNPVFTSTDAAAISSLPVTVSGPIVTAALSLSGLTEDETEKKAAASN